MDLELTGSAVIAIYGAYIFGKCLEVFLFLMSRTYHVLMSINML